MGSTCYNPFLYAVLNENFRKEFRLILPCCFRDDRQQNQKGNLHTEATAEINRKPTPTPTTENVNLTVTYNVEGEKVSLLTESSGITVDHHASNNEIAIQINPNKNISPIKEKAIEDL